MAALFAVLSALFPLVASASATTLAWNAANEPVVVGARPDLGPGALRLRFESPRKVEVDALGAAVLALRPGVEPPPELRAEGTALGSSERTWWIPAHPGEDALDVCRRWAGHPAVASVLPDLLLPRRPYDVALDDPRYPGQWYHELLGTEALWEISFGDPTVPVAVVDSGIEIAHPDLAAGIADPYDAYADDDDPSPDPGEFCFDGAEVVCDEHGPAVAGIVGARANNGEGIVGFCPGCTLVPIKLLGEGAGALHSDVAAFEHAIDSGAAVISNSWGYVESIPVPAPLAAVIRRAASETRGGLGSVVVFAAGNDDRVIEDDELQAMDEVLCVGATDRYGNPTAYTNEGATVDLAAPSATVTTSHSGGYTETFGGTSAAAPVVSGVAGWILSVEPDLTATEVRALLMETARPSPLVTHDESGHHPVYGYGELDLDALLEALYPETGGACACSGAGGVAPFWPVLPALWALVTRRRGRSLWWHGGGATGGDSPCTPGDPADSTRAMR
ncbi:MAG: S8 family serine peptidase [Deltaproteobacteria bacterium]|nr:S8 family serine peptidase [Deltaproteobacteria bacterium]